MLRKKSAFFVLLVMLLSFQIQAQTLQFSGYTWGVRDGYGGPGPNNWSSNNAWVDASGYLHLKITYVNGVWYCPEVYTLNRFKFGQYWFYVNSRVDQMDPNVVFGIFNYPTPDVGVDGTNEIDIEFARWGSNSPAASNTSYTVWPVNYTSNNVSLNYTSYLSGNFSTHGFTWHYNQITYQSGNGHYQNYSYPIMSWTFAPPDYINRIPQQAMPIYLNLWLLDGEPPTNGAEVEVIIQKFIFKASNN